MYRKIKIELAVGIILILVIIVGAVIVKESREIRFENPKTAAHKKTGGVVCTMEAKLCADGSYVSRTGPNCEFKLCPETNAGCVKEGESIGAVYPGVVPKKCCDGLSPIIPQGIVGTQGICQKIVNK